MLIINNPIKFNIKIQNLLRFKSLQKIVYEFLLFNFIIIFNEEEHESFFRKITWLNTMQQKKIKEESEKKLIQIKSKLYKLLIDFDLFF